MPLVTLGKEVVVDVASLEVVTNGVSLELSTWLFLRLLRPALESSGEPGLVRDGERLRPTSFTDELRPPAPPSSYPPCKRACEVCVRFARDAARTAAPNDV